jgi:putative ABC transport system permease protein
VQVTSANYLPRLKSSFIIDAEYKLQGKKGVPMIRLNADEQFAICFDLDITYGRNFRPNEPGDKTNFLINESAAKALDIEPSKAVGQIVESRNGKTGTLIGVFRDFPIQTIRNKIDPVIISANPHQIDVVVYAKIAANNLQPKLEQIQQAWSAVLPDLAFDFQFVSDQFRKLYNNDIKVLRITATIAGFAILITFLGLYTLALFWVKDKTRESAIRRIHGAARKDILGIFIKKVSMLFLLSSLISVPIAYFGINDVFLNQFANRVSINPAWILGLTFAVYLCALSITIIKTFRASTVLISEVLRAE